jgi:GH15 family glucan-1,4-alpha-glucosidase
MSERAYPPIGDYGFIADCHSSALVSKSGSIDWSCMPRVDSTSCFGRILDWESGGYCKIAPDAEYSTTRRYLDGTLVLETTFRTGAGEARVTDCLTMRAGGEHEPHRQILRVVEGVKGSVKLTLDIVPRFDYGAVKPWIRRAGGGGHVAVGGSDGLFISGDFPVRMKHRHDLIGSCTVKAGDKLRLSLIYRKPEELDEGLPDVPAVEELDRRLQETIAWWRNWSGRCTFNGRYREQALRSAIVLKGLTNAPTGAFSAAPTTSLPEAPGGPRNWDYRYSWLRDSAFSVRSMAELGFVKEADGFRRFVERAAAGSADQLQIMYGVGGERRLVEIEVKHMEGYRGSRPVRIGNAAERQTQLDVYGELLDLAYHWHSLGHSPDDDYWEFLVELVNKAASRWRSPDQGIWEMRGEPRHFVLSKAMCWVALDRGLKLLAELKRTAPESEWVKARDEVCSAVETKGYDKKRGVFVQAFDHPIMDASLLLLPMFGFVDYADERMLRTVDAVEKDLCEDGLIRRYAPGEEGMEGTEGTFLACSFWLAECLARQGKLERAHKVFRRAADTGNDLCLFSEEYDTEAEEMMGNFPQGLTHLSLISTAVAFAEAEGR